MMIMCDMNKLLVSCTLGDFAEAIAQVLNRQQPSEAPAPTTRCVKGLKGLQEIFSCSEWRARQIKASGLIDAAIIQLGVRTFVVDAEKALQLYNQNIN